ncbi:hypothetical protein GGU11DRAFT_800136 [Lentinula aff. detonsa]|uniref:Myosin-binding domain-containing protein n=1 Tax=Lentinula aff. detonsa TaxID=2804958 RepID=A0AA38KVW9_9AGAR|nr:hypothetical protein GGU10DRAFT_356369 [Lentinula aff. detonsa]KAJ3793345.1 hypothetical protein GGU11DRAFT_800136 [Lentinula aff. detonsa]
MPGGAAEFMPESGEGLDDTSFESGSNHQFCPNFLKDIAQTLRSIISNQSSSAFVERFKYSVISSPLLSPSLLQPHNHRPPRLPGHHSRDSSPTPSDFSQQPTHSLPQDPQYYTFFLALALVTVLLGAGYYFTSLALFGISVALLHIWNFESSSKYDMTPYLGALNDLIAAGNVWDSAVQEAMTTLEKNEENISVTPFSPSSTLRVALHSTLLTTQNQCDDVRQLLSALASHSELSQISEMYAPPSPTASKSFSPLSPSRPSSYPEATHSRTRTRSVPDIAENKRATWNGSYSYLANAGSPSLQLTKRREKRRSDLSALLQATAIHSSQSRSAPATPIAEEKLEDNPEEKLRTANDDGNRTSHHDHEPEECQPFGTSALRLRRTRTIGGLKTLRASISLPGSPPVKSTSSLSSLTSFPARSPRTSQYATIPSASRFTAMQAPRHPLSLSSLNTALQNAFASKRYTCSHLLALRFSEEGDDETYWEDVKSVMMLLTSTFVDASARLTEALDFVEDQKLKDETPSPGPSRVEITFDETKQSSLLSRRRTSLQRDFAPMPSDLSRFATHVEAISSALDDAREQLIECVAALKYSRDGSDYTVRQEEVSSSSEKPPAREEHPALQAYERIRRELGLALRECERGRERLLDIVSPQQQSDDSEDGFSPRNSAQDLPSLGHNPSDQSSDRPDSMPPSEYELSAELTSPDCVTIVNSVDDVTSHLLLTSTSQHLPPPGIEQVFEGDSGAVGNFRRERSKLSREERILLATKAKESQKRQSGDRSSSSSTERWGPGGEVVQELRDVIWKVGERRRKMVDGQIHNVVPEAIRVLD